MISGDVVNDVDMPDGKAVDGKRINYFRDCFNPANLKLSVWNDPIPDADDNSEEPNKWNNDYNVLERDATTCYMKHKFKKQLTSDDPKVKLSCNEGTFMEVLNASPSICTQPL